MSSRGGAFFPNEEFIGIGGELTAAQEAWVAAAALVGLPTVAKAGKIFGVNSDGTTFELATASGSGFTRLNATETPDGSSLVFTFPSKPTYIINGGVWYTVNSGWTWNTTTLQATMSVPPPFGQDFWGFV